MATTSIRLTRHTRRCVASVGPEGLQVYTRGAPAGSTPKIPWQELRERGTVIKTWILRANGSIEPSMAAVVPSNNTRQTATDKSLRPDVGNIDVTLPQDQKIKKDWHWMQWTGNYVVYLVDDECEPQQQEQHALLIQDHMREQASVPGSSSSSGQQDREGGGGGQEQIEQLQQDHEKEMEQLHEKQKKQRDQLRQEQKARREELQQLQQKQLQRAQEANGNRVQGDRKQQQKKRKQKEVASTGGRKKRREAATVTEEEEKEQAMQALLLLSTPDTPQRQAPAASDIPQSQVPTASDIPQVPTASDIPQVPTASDIPQVPTASDTVPVDEALTEVAGMLVQISRDRGCVPPLIQDDIFSHLMKQQHESCPNGDASIKRTTLDALLLAMSTSEMSFRIKVADSYQWSWIERISKHACNTHQGPHELDLKHWARQLYLWLRASD